MYATTDSASSSSGNPNLKGGKLGDRDPLKTAAIVAVGGLGAYVVYQYWWKNKKDALGGRTDRPAQNRTQ